MDVLAIFPLSLYLPVLAVISLALSLSSSPPSLPLSSEEQFLFAVSFQAEPLLSSNLPLCFQFFPPPPASALSLRSRLAVLAPSAPLLCFCAAPSFCNRYDSPRDQMLDGKVRCACIVNWRMGCSSAAWDVRCMGGTLAVGSAGWDSATKFQSSLVGSRE